MKKIIFLLIVLLLPILVYADTCDNSKIVITDVEKLDSNGYVEEINRPSINNQSLLTNLKFYDVGDSITYSFKVKNNSNEDYYISKNISNDEYTKYELLSDSNKIKAGEEKTIQLKITYNNKVNNSLFKSNKYIQNKELNIILGDNLINPSTGLSRLIIYLGTFELFKDKKYLNLIVLLFIPLFVNASCQYKITIISNIEYKKILPNPCTYEGELVPGVEYVNGQYTYRYMQENYGDENGDGIFEWINISNDGWGVRLTNIGSTEPVTTTLCSSINNKPIVSMTGMFAESQPESIDLSSFDTSNVTNMRGMFYNSQATTLDLSNFDTGNVEYMDSMFTMSKLTSLDVSSFDTSNVTTMRFMFVLVHASTIDVSSFDTKNVTDMSYMFAAVNTSNIDLKNFDTKNVVNMESMFDSVSANSIDLSSFDTSNVVKMYNMFLGSQITSLDISSFDTSNISSMDSIFCGSKIEKLYVGNFFINNVPYNIPITNSETIIKCLDFSKITITNDYIADSLINDDNLINHLQKVIVRDQDSADIIHNKICMDAPIYIGDNKIYESSQCDFLNL